MALTAEQLKGRKVGIGGSDASAVLGVSRWKNPLQVFLEKTSESLENIYEEQDNGPAYFGNILEDIVAQEFEKKTGKKVEKVVQQLSHPDYPFLIANIDRKVVGEDAVLECKTTSAWNEKYWEEEDVPIEYLIQTMHYMAVNNYKKGYLAVLVGGNKFIWKEIHRNEELIKKIVDREVHFWNEFVLKKVPPAIDGSEASAKIIKALYPFADDTEVVNLSDDFNSLLDERDKIKGELDTLEDRKKEIENKIKFELGNAGIGLTSKYQVTFKNQVSGRLNGKALEKDHPEIFNAYVDNSTIRVLRIKELKK